MGPNPNGPRSVSCDRAIRYSGFFGVRSFVGPTVGDFLDFMKLLTAIRLTTYNFDNWRRYEKI